jgi:hypothetical protein
MNPLAPLRILSPTAILGYGFPDHSFEEGMRRQPDLIAVDAGSTDPGPYYLGAGVSFTDRGAVYRDLDRLLPAAVAAGIPLFIGSAGGCGGEPHLAWTLDIVREIARKRGLTFRMASIHAEVDRRLVLERLADGRLAPLPPAPGASVSDIESTVRIVGQMGLEPFVRAFEAGAQVIVAGRAYDPAVFAALAVHLGYDRGLALHLGKILECACIAATPGSGSDCMLGTLDATGFTVETLSPARHCTELSVAAHTLYEKSDPTRLPGPGGVLDLTATTFRQSSDNAVRVEGSRFIETKPYRIKLEGVRSIGFRAVSIAGIRDPVLIGCIEETLAAVRSRVLASLKGIREPCSLDFIVYGRNGVMGALEPVDPRTAPAPHELGLVIEAVAPSQDEAATLCAAARSTLLHYGYPGRISTAGNLAFPYSPSDFKAGEVFAFSLYHLIDVSDPCELFPIDLEEVAP